MDLSIIIISHNQRDLLKRCIESVLAQNILLDYEIIISDDSSTDGSWELALKYSLEYHNIKVTQCNTDDYHPSNTSERSGWNRCNGYKIAIGKYIAHIDGDDYLKDGTNIYSKQIELLEKFQQCSCCMANDYVLKEGDDISKAVLKHKEHFKTGEILTSERYIKTIFRESHCFVYRRNSDVDPVNLYGGYYVDAMITDHHLQFGDIICLDDAGYVYVQYKKSIWNETITGQDYKLLIHVLYIPLLIPKWHNSFLSSTKHLKKILKVVRLALSNYRVGEANLLWCSRFDRYLYHVFNRKLNIGDYLHLSVLYFYVVFLIIVKPSINFLYRLLDKML